MRKTKLWIMVAIMVLGMVSAGVWATPITIVGNGVGLREGAPDSNMYGSGYGFTRYYYGAAQMWAKFDLASLTPPTGMTLQLNSVTVGGGGSELGAAPIYQDAAWFCSNDSWAPASLTWNTRPMADLGEKLAVWDMVKNPDYAVTRGDGGSPALTARVQQEAMGDGFLSILVDTNVERTGGDSHNYYNGNFSLAVDYEFVPEPMTLSILGLGGLFLRMRRKNS